MCALLFSHRRTTLFAHLYQLVATARVAKREKPNQLHERIRPTARDVSVTRVTSTTVENFWHTKVHHNGTYWLGTLPSRWEKIRGMWKWKGHSDAKLVIVSEDGHIRGKCSVCELIFLPDTKLGTGITQDAYLQERFREHMAHKKIGEV